jgi:hypothetical protein
MSVFSSIDRHAALMDRMADTLGVDLAELSLRGELAPEAYRQAVLRCTGCTDPGGCAKWTAAHPEGASRAPGFCRNKEQMERLARG